MSDRIQAIVLSKVEYGDKTLIIDLYGLQSGRTTASTYSTKKSKNRFYFSPLMLLEVEVFTSKKAKLKKIKEVKSVLPIQMAINSTEINAYRYFIAEFLQKTLPLDNPDPQLFQFLMNTIAELYEEDLSSNFIHQFLEKLSPFLGLDLQEIRRQGGSASDYGLEFSQGDWTKFISNDSLSAKERLSLLIQFYAQHFEGVKHLKSRAILAEIFA